MTPLSYYIIFIKLSSGQKRRRMGAHFSLGANYGILRVSRRGGQPRRNHHRTFLDWLEQTERPIFGYGMLQKVEGGKKL